jgi:hypothetical protein
LRHAARQMQTPAHPSARTAQSAVRPAQSAPARRMAAGAGQGGARPSVAAESWEEF